MELPLYVYLLLAFLLLLLNAFFVLAEFAAVKMRATRIEELVDQGNPRAKLVQNIQAHLDEYLSVCQVGITFSSIGLGFVGEPAFARMLEPILGSWAWAHAVAITMAYVVALSHACCAVLAIVWALGEPTYASPEQIQRSPNQPPLGPPLKQGNPDHEKHLPVDPPLAA